jgi:hypothetical protein
MGFPELVLLGAIAGFTIYLGMPAGRLGLVDERVRVALPMFSVGILAFIFMDVTKPSTSFGRPQHDDVTAGAGDASDGVHKLALYKRPALDLEAQSDDEHRRCVEVSDSDADMVETSYVRHEVRPPGVSWCRGPRLSRPFTG